MSNGGVPNTISVDGAGQVGSPAPAEVAADTTTASVDPGDFDSRFRSDPDWALEKYKNLQGDYTRDRQKMKAATRAFQLAETLGGGDIASGSEAAERLLVDYNAIRSNPRMRTMVDGFLQSGMVPEGGAAAESPEIDPYEDPSAKELRELRGTVVEQAATLARLEGRSVQNDLERHMEQFFRDWPLEKDEQSEVLSELQQTFGSHSKTPEGRRILKDLKYSLVETIALQRLGRDKIREVSLRMARAKSTDKQARATDAGAPVRTTGEEAVVGEDVYTAMRRMAERLGIDPRKSLTRQ